MSAKSTSLQEALNIWKDKNNGEDQTQAKIVKLIGFIPPIEKLEPTILNELVEATQLSLSSNRITNMVDLDLSKLQILSLSRNMIKKIVGVDGVRGTLQELWLSQNKIDSLSGLSRLENLEVLQISNNEVQKWVELEKLTELPELRSLLLKENPFYRFADDKEEKTNRLKTIKQLPNLKMLDGERVKPEEKLASEALVD